MNRKEPCRYCDDKHRDLDVPVEQVSGCAELSDVNCPGCKAPESLKQWVVDVWEKAEHWSFSTTYEARSSDEARSLARAQYGRGYTIRGVCRGAF